MSTQCHCPSSPTVVPFGSIDLVIRHDQDGQNQQDKPQCPMEEQFLALKKELEEALSLAGNKAAYQLCEFYSFRNPQKKKGFELAHGELLESAIDLYPEAWAFLQTDEGKALCVTEDEWQAMTHATWATLADGTKVGFDGIGGAPFYVQDIDAGTLRLPDIRGMVAEASGFDGLTVGGVHGDMSRKLYDKNFVRAYNAPGGNWEFFITYNHEEKPGLFESTYDVKSYGIGDYDGLALTSSTRGLSEITFDTSKATPTGNANKPRAFGVLPCVYLGNSK